MTKKPNKPNLPQETLERARKELYGTRTLDEQQEQEIKAANPAVKFVAQESKGSRLVREVNLAEEYSYVVKDLRSMASLAAMLFVVLIAMSFFI